MKRSNRFFSASLYKEGLLQLRFMGFLSGGLIVLASGAQILLMLATLHSSGSGVLGGLAFAADPTVLLSFAGVAVWLLPFLFVFRLFNFLNKRNRSDFYHALPVSRLKLYGSFLAAILTWIWSIGLIVVALTGTASLIGGAAVTASAVTSALGLFLTGSLFAVAASLVAVSITGTRFSSLVVTALIVLLPRMIVACFTLAGSVLLPNIPREYIGTLGGLQVSNTFFAFSPLTALGGAVAPTTSSAANGASIVATLVWSLILVVVGARSFIRRPSEAAEKSAPSRRLQLIYRVAIGVLIVALGMSAVISSLAPADSGLRGVWVALGVILLLALIGTLVFEFITTRKWGRLLRALPSFALVIAFSLAFSGAVALYVSYEKGFRPAADQIASVKLLSTGYSVDMGVMNSGLSGLFMDQTGQLPTYNSLRMRQTSITDAALIQESASKLQEPATYNLMYGGQDENHTVMLLEVQLKSGRTAHRLISVRTGKKPDSFSTALFSTPEAARALLALPKPDAHTQLESYAYLNSSGGPAISPVSKAQRDRRTRELFETFRSEYERLSPQEQYQVLNWMYRGSPFKVSGETTSAASFLGGGNIDVRGLLGAQTFMNSYPLTLPRSAEARWKMTRSELEKLFQEKKKGFYVDSLDLFTPQAMLTANGMNDGGGPAEPLWSVFTKRYAKTTGGAASYATPGADPSEVSDAQMEEATAILREALSRGFSADAPYFVQMSYGVYNERGQEIGQNGIVVSLTAREAAALRALTK